MPFQTDIKPFQIEPFQPDVAVAPELPIDTISEPERPGLFNRAIKGFINKVILDPLGVIKQRGFGSLNVELESLKLLQEQSRIFNNLSKEEFDELSFREQLALPEPPLTPEGEISNLQAIDALAKRNVAERVVRLEVPKAETVPEKIVEVGSSVAAFIGRLAVTRKVLSVQPGDFIGSVVTWETENIATGGTPGRGAAMRLALGGIDVIPVATLVGKTGQLGAKSALFGGLAAAAGGDKEDIIIASLLPLAFAAWNKAGREVRKGRAKRAIAIVRKDATAKGLNLKGVPDQSLQSIIDMSKDAKFWNTELAKGRITPEIHGQRLSEIRNRVSPILDAVVQQQKRLGVEKVAIVPTEKPPRPTPVRPAAAPVAVAPVKAPIIPPKMPVRPVVPVKAKVPTKQIEVSDAEAAKLLGESLEKIQANRALKERLSKELIITDFTPSDFVPKAKKGPGLTRAEQQLVTPEVQGKLRFAQTQELPVGFKAGQKESNDIAKRRLDDFRTTRKVEKGLLQDARKLITEYAKDPVVAKKLITSLANVNTPAKLSAFADKIGEFVREAERKQAITSYKTTFNKLKKDNRLGKVAFGKLREPARQRILKFADTIDLQKLSVAKKEELEVLMQQVKDLGVDLSEGIAQLDVDTQDALKQLDPHVVALDRLQKTAVSDMGFEEVQIAEDSLRYIVRQNEIQNKEIFGKRVVDAKVREKKAVKEVSVSKKQKRIFARETRKGVVEPKKRAGIFALLKKGVVGQSRTVPTLVQVSTTKGATATKDVLDTKVWDGIRETNRVTFESVDFLKEGFAKHNITDKTIDTFDKKFKVKLGGKVRSVTAGDLGAIEMHLRSLDNIEQLRKTKAMWIQGKRVPGITIQEYVKAAENLTEKQLRFLDIIGNMNRTTTAPAVNVSTENLWGYPIARDVNYYPLPRKFPVKAEGPVTAFSQAVEQQSPFQPRTGGTQDLALIPVVEQMWQTLQIGARMAGTAEPFHNARTLLNSENWQNKMIESGRQDEMNDIIKIFRRTQGMSSDKNLLEVSFQRILGPVTKSKLSLRVTTPLVQAASFPVAFSEIDGKYAVPLKDYRAQIGKAQLARLKKFSPTLRLRFEGGRISPEVGLISAADGFKMLVFGKVSHTSKPLIPLRAVDRKTILAIDIMAQRFTRDTTNLKGDAFWEVVSLKTEEVTRLTQPMFDHFARSVILTSPNVLLRSGTAFRAPREAMLNVSVRANDLFAKGENAKAARSWGSVFSSVVMARLIKLGIGAGVTAAIAFLVKGRIPKREKEFSDFAADIANDAISIVPFAEIIRPAVNVALDKKGFNEVKLNNLLLDFTVTAGKVAVDGTKAVKQAIDGDTEKAKKSLGRALTGTIQTVAEVKGLPFTGPRDIIKPALKEKETVETFGRRVRTRTTRTRKTRTFGRQR